MDFHLDAFDLVFDKSDPVNDVKQLDFVLNCYSMEFDDLSTPL